MKHCYEYTAGYTLHLHVVLFTHDCRYTRQHTHVFPLHQSMCFYTESLSQVDPVFLSSIFTETDAITRHGAHWLVPLKQADLSGIHRSFFAMRHAMRQTRNRENPKSQPCRTPRNCRNWAIAGHRRSWAWLNFCDAMRCDKRYGVRFWPFYSKVGQRFKSCL